MTVWPGVAWSAGVGSADPRDAASFRRPTRRTFHGRCLAVLRPTGPRGAATLRASADGLSQATVRLEIA